MIYSQGTETIMICHSASAAFKELTGLDLPRLPRLRLGLTFRELELADDITSAESDGRTKAWTVFQPQERVIIFVPADVLNNFVHSTIADQL